MRAVVVYESMYGNTHRVADAIGAGLEPSFDVTVLPVAKDNALDPGETDRARDWATKLAASIAAG